MVRRLQPLRAGQVDPDLRLRGVELLQRDPGLQPGGLTTAQGAQLQGTLIGVVRIAHA